MVQKTKRNSGLSAAERATIASGNFSGEYTADALLDQMRTLADFDRRNDAARAKLKTRVGLSIFLAIVSLFLLKILPKPPVFAISGTLLLFAVYCGVRLSQLTKLDISNNFRDVALPFLAVLKQDILPTQTVSVNIDLRAPTHAQKRSNQGEPYTKGAYEKIVDTTYRDAWFNGSARLADESVVRWDVVDDIIDSRRTKRSSSGKLKTKSRQLRRTTIAVALSVSAKRYGIGDRQAGDDRLAVAESGKRRVLKIVRKIKAKSSDPMPPEALIDVVANLYQRLNAPASAAA